MATATHGQRHLNRDKLFMVDQLDAARCALEALHPVASLEPDELVAGICVLFSTICFRVGLDPEEAYLLGKRLLLTREPGNHKTNNTLQTLSDFAGLRIKGDDVTIA